MELNRLIFVSHKTSFGSIINIKSLAVNFDFDRIEKEKRVLHTCSL